MGLYEVIRHENQGSGVSGAIMGKLTCICVVGNISGLLFWVYSFLTNIRLGGEGIQYLVSKHKASLRGVGTVPRTSLNTLSKYILKKVSVHA